MTDSPDLLGFAKTMFETWCDLEGCDLDSGSLQEILEAHGLLKFRAPKPSELEDLEWWGHEYYDERHPNAEIVGEKTEAFVAMIKGQPVGGSDA